jgi:hypothetical protein
VVQALDQLPEALTTAILTASPFHLRHHLSILPDSLHPLAIEAAFPSILRHQSLRLELQFPQCADKIGLNGDATSALAVLHAATTSPRGLKEVDLSGIPVQTSDRLLKLISKACMSASNVSLAYECKDSHNLPELQHIAQLGAALACSSALTSLHYMLYGWLHGPGYTLDCLLEALTSLQRLSVVVRRPYREWGDLPVPRCITNLVRVTDLRLGPVFNLADVPAILPHMTKLRALKLYECCRLQDLPDLATLTALQTLKLKSLVQLPH